MNYPFYFNLKVIIIIPFILKIVILGFYLVKNLFYLTL